MLAVLLIATIQPVARGQEGPEEEGSELYVESCASCHGADAEGTEQGPSLAGVGAASADFYLRTGRMPLASTDAQAVTKEPVFDDPQIESLVAYLDSLGDGPPIPAVDLSDAALASGQELFTDNCAACHGATGAGGAVGSNAIASSLYESEPVQIAEATIVGPGQMPVFGFSEEERNNLIAYVMYLQNQPHPGGADIGGIGPVAEGFVAWIAGMAVLLAVAVVIGKTKVRESVEQSEA